MKLSKQKKEEIIQVYDTWLFSYLNGDVETYNKYLDKDYHFIGSTNNEEFLNKKDTTNFFEETADQLAGKCDLRNETRIIEKFGELVFITHLFDAWFLNDNDWAYYGRFRFTNTLKQNNDGWRFIYQHFSTTDSKTDEGETIGFDRVNEENQELREAIKRRTFELEQKNRELEIEGALERIRAQAVAMKATSDLLDIVVTMRNEFIKLGHEAHYFWHMMWLPDTYEKAMTSGDGSKIGFVMKLPRHIHGDIPLLAKWEKSKKETVVYTMNVDEALDYVNKMITLGDFQNIDPQAPTEEDVRHIGGLTFIMARTTHGEIGYSLPGIVKNPPKEDIDILVKFAGAFDLAHQRFLDLQKAERQARETQIELALEKVRSRTMAMQHSNELAETSLVLFEQFKNLGQISEQISIGIFNDTEKTMSLYSTLNGKQWEEEANISLKEPIVMKKINKAWKQNNKHLVLDLSGTTLKKYNEYRNTLSNLKYQEKRWVIHVTFFSQGIITFSATKPHSNETIELLQRFSKVFEQTYTRFLDLKKAEAQARETQIELALEKVRSRTMAMQQSEELADVATVLFQQVKELGIEQWTCGFNIWETGDTEFTFYPGGPDGEILSSCKVPLMEHPIFRQFDESRRRGDELLVYEKEGDIQKDHYRYMHSLPGIGDMLQGMLDSGLEFPDFQIDHVANFSYGNMVFITYEPFPEMHNVFKRFAKVFEQTYTRFLDLQKAEAQAREAQIEAALEKVRSRSLAVHKSGEFIEVVSIVFEKLKELQIPATAVGIAINIEGSKDLNAFVCGENEAGLVITNYRLPYFNNKISKDISNVLEKQLDFYVGHYSKKVKNSFYKYVLEHTDEFRHLPEDILSMIFESPSYTISMVAAKHSIFNINDFEGKELSKNDIDILKRFTKVFDQAYIRFLDLQKAEKQAREKEIELALEKVRSRTMAMQHSDELQEASFLLDQQVRALGIKTWGCAFNIYGEKDSTEWFGNEAGVLPTYTVPRKGIFKEYYQKGKKGELLFIKEFSGDECVSHYEYMSSLPVIGDILMELKETNNGFPTYQIDHVVYFKYGYLLFITKEHVPDAHDVFKRFAKVFEQTFTRFLDLQKAEAQAKEAQIEAALERIRSRSLAMHNSNEIGDVAFVLFEQLKSLGGELWGTGFGFCENNSDVDEFWFANENGVMPQLKIPNTIDPSHEQMYKGWKKNLKSLSIIKDGKELKDHYKYMLTVPDVQPIFQGLLDNGIAFPKWQKWHAAYFKYGYLLVITTEVYKNEVVFKRFAKVFEQAYTRFLDLQKAEAQAREAQIEASLERVRSRAMAIQTSNELDEVIQIIFEELGKLDVQLMECSIATYDINPKDLIYRSAGPIGALQPKSVKLQYFDHPLLNDLFKDLENGIKYRSGELSGKILKTWWDSVFTKTDFKNAPKKFIASWKSVKSIFYSQFAIKHGFLEFLGNSPLEKDKVQLLERFTNVIDLTYSRYDDVVKAEYQAREAQIETALERVRSRSMAMHKSEELKDVIQVLYDQFIHLNINIEHAGFILDYKENDDMHIWLADHNAVFPKIVLPYFDCAHWNSFNKAKKNGTDFFTNKLDFKEKNKFYKDLFEFIPDLPEETKATYFSFKGLAISTVLLEHIGLYIENYSGIPFSDAENSILMRFGKVFQQTYTRFLDLQKAEAQAREAQIETALEKVRSRTMAMQNSDELPEVANTLFLEIQGLGIPSWSCGFNILSKDKTTSQSWMSSEGEIQKPFNLAFKKEASFIEMYDFFKSDTTFLIQEIDGEAIKSHYNYLKSLPGLKPIFDDLDKKGIPLPTYQINHLCKFKEGYLLFITYEKVPDAHDIFKRFTTVFEQTYTRFLDLQRAEAQAREAQIEMALEKVRSRTMAMQNSSELPEAANNLFLQVQELGIPAWSAGYCIWEDNQKSASCNMSSEGEIQKNFSLPTIGEGYNFYKPLKNGESFHVAELGGKKLVKHYDFMKKLPIVGEILKDFDKKGIELPTFQIFHIVYFTHGYLMFITYEAVPNDWDVFKRFGKVFEQTYTRFLDLQKAEAQAREAQIETALEKVRSRTMAMQKGEEVKDVVVLLYKELIALGVTNFATCGYVEINEKTNKQETWVTNPGGDSLGLFYLPLTGDVHFDARYEAWKKQQTVFYQTVAGKERKKHLEYAITTFNSKEAEEMVLTQFPDPTVFYCFNFSHGYLHLVSGSNLKEDEEILLARFTRVFEQTYARFLDLEKAEAQTRAAQINLAVERVRAKALAMHKSEEIIEVVAKLKDEVMSLDIPDVVAATIFLNEGDDKVRMWDLSSLEHEDNYLEVPFDVTFKIKKTDPHLYVKRVWENQEDYFVEIQDEKDFKRLMQWLREQNKNEIAAEVEDFIEKIQLKRLYHSAKKLNNGKLVIDQLNPPTDEMETILTKMGAAFDLAYKRFEDLKKAEAQTREAQIEAALEKVRSRSLAMHKPDELQEVVAVVAEKLKELGVIFDAGGVILCTYFPDNKDVVHWIAVDDFSTSGRYFVPYFDNPIFSEAWDSKINGDAYFSKEFPVEAKNDFFKQAFESSDYSQMPDDYKQFVLQADKHHLSAAWSKNSAIIIPSLTGAVPSDDDAEIMKRFAKVFEQAYIRFMDLEKVEAQARESEIEAALERVRSRSMAMHKSEDMLEVINVVSEQLQHLGIKFHNVSFGINDENKDYKFWLSSPQQLYPFKLEIPYLDNPMPNRVLEAQKNKVSFFTDILTKQESDAWHNHLLEHSGHVNFHENTKNFISNSPGYARSTVLMTSIFLTVGNYALIPYSEEENDIFKRFANVFEQSYTRFLDLQKAEAQAREAQIETALERVRSRTMAMQKSEELAETSVVVFQQLLELGVSPNRLFIGIIKDKGQTLEAWATNEDGSKIASHFNLQASKNKSIKKMLSGWKQHKSSLIIDMKGKELQGYFKYLNNEMNIPFMFGLDQKRRVQTIAYFSGGLIGMAAPEEQPDDTIRLLERFASVFNLTYTRFNDLKVAEAQAKKAEEDLINLQLAKKSAEDALKELQLTQTQLIQSEKMASLGELTAGIAHEIQNPLNFVNNFSEVSKELLDEMIEELEKGDMEEVKAITDDVIQNLEKINHHGKRADGIVKGMLQHSRSSTGTKEPTNINTLADEYLRLAYHGLRAKDKSFNATLVTDFDDKIGTINIIPQDIGRVILNLFTNAFYAVNMRKQLNIDGYEPTVSLTTKKNGNLVSISVKDNGNGIPKKVVDKIFQPFFTTKPTGEGTGLGLSMSYDIVTKGHGGELKVNTAQNKGTEFIIELPNN